MMQLSSHLGCIAAVELTSTAWLNGFRDVVSLRRRRQRCGGISWHLRGSSGGRLSAFLRQQIVVGMGHLEEPKSAADSTTRYPFFLRLWGEEVSKCVGQAAGRDNVPSGVHEGTANHRANTLTHAHAYLSEKPYVGLVVIPGFQKLNKEKLHN